LLISGGAIQNQIFLWFGKLMSYQKNLKNKENFRTNYEKESIFRADSEEYSKF
jgi:hypothetical protein